MKLFELANSVDPVEAAHEKQILPFNPLYTVGLFHCYMLGKSICNFRGVGSVLSR